MTAVDLDSTILVLASRAQWIRSIHNHASVWGVPLTEEQHLEKELILEKYELCTDGKFECWVLVSKDDTSTLDFLCSCETFHRRVLVSSSGRPCTSHNAHSIASVWCPPQHRRRGYAGRMMRLLHEKLANADWMKRIKPGIEVAKSNRSLLSVLYSDIGDYYSRAKPPGWHIRGREETTWTVRSSDLPPSLPSSVAPISESDLIPLAQSDAARMRSELPLASQQDGRICFAIEPNGHDVGWLVGRSLYYARTLPNRRSLGGGDCPVPSVWGAKVSEDEWATWFLDLAKGTLYFTRIRCEGLESFQKLLAAARSFAYAQGVSKIKAWCLDRRLADASGGKTVQREDSLSAVAWYGGETFDGVNVDEAASEVEWLYNEKYAWC